MSTLECGGVYSCGQSPDLYTMELYFSLLIGVVLSVLIWQVVDRFKRRSKDVNAQSGCASESCVRCHRKTLAKSVASERFRKLEDTLIYEVSSRIKSAVLGRDDQLPADQKPNVLFIPNLSSNHLFDDYVDDTAILKKLFPKIKEEFIEIFTRHLDKWTTNITPSGEWSVFYLRNQGQLMKSNCNLCPNTFQAITTLQNAMTNCIFANAAFSVLQPKTRIEPHYGPTNVRIRCHLGLITPPNASLTVRDQSLTWQMGECLLFDDSFLHSAQHTGSNSAGIRAIFMVDLWHPSLILSEREIIQKCYGSRNS